MEDLLSETGPNLDENCIKQVRKKQTCFLAIPFWAAYILVNCAGFKSLWLIFAWCCLLFQLVLMSGVYKSESWEELPRKIPIQPVIYKKN